MASTSTALTRFPKFGELPAEGKGRSSSEVNNKHEFKFHLTTAGNRLLGLRVNVESRNETLRLLEKFIQFRGPKIYFDPNKQYIHFDLESLHALWLYTHGEKENFGSYRSTFSDGYFTHEEGIGRISKLVGFNSIKKISVSRSLNHLLDSLRMLASDGNVTTDEQVTFPEHPKAHTYCGPLMSVEEIVGINLRNTYTDLRINYQFWEDKFKVLLERPGITEEQLWYLRDGVGRIGSWGQFVMLDLGPDDNTIRALKYDRLRSLLVSPDEQQWCCNRDLGRPLDNGCSSMTRIEIEVVKDDHPRPTSFDDFSSRHSFETRDLIYD
ncbi:hypothetical protein G7Y89_g4989 [Cudoniella acicularis]|uniref:Uncharacterized protein n=1 Tax=Cudoniella acicularis TaxID=354080 RepID=A0A8H4RP48_9HELO|nr:hypothetical protein G7Y89_g4989 [Cudoniella acicularis]